MRDERLNSISDLYKLLSQALESQSAVHDGTIQMLVARIKRMEQTRVNAPIATTTH
jgi:hypothetical protein